MNTKQRLYLEIENHLMSDERPSEFLKGNENRLKVYPFTMLLNLKNARQSPVYHPEGTAWEHTMLVVDEAAKRKSESGSERAFMWAALLHDIGKPGTTQVRQGRITSYHHEKLGAELAERFFGEFEEDGAFIREVCALIRWHMQILHVVKSMSFADIKAMKDETSAQEVALLGLCDRLGRLGADAQKEKENIRVFLEKCKEVI